MYTKYDACGHYLEISEEDSSRYDTVLAHGLMLASHHGAYHIAEYLIKQGTKVNSANKVGRYKDRYLISRNYSSAEKFAIFASLGS